MNRIAYTSEGVDVKVSLYDCDGRREAHAIFIPASGSDGWPAATGSDGRPAATGGIGSQAKLIAGALRSFLDFASGKGLIPVMKRAYLSDPANGAESVAEAFDDIPGTLSLVGQPPMYEGVKVALLVVMTEDAEVSPASGNAVAARHGSYCDLWMGAHSIPGADSHAATSSLLSFWQTMLEQSGMSLANDCLRTWFYVRDIDNRYSGMVRARNEFFAECGLTPATHFIASTGIEGCSPSPTAVVTLEAWASEGLTPGQVSHLTAPTHLNRTAEYGVAFERATAVKYGDRRHVIVSGTASINNKGEIVAPGDVAAQCHRMAENVEALLGEGMATPGDIAHIVMYLRDGADRSVAEAFLARRFPDVPAIVLKASVCRPGWLVEMECMAIAKDSNPGYAPY